MGYIWKALEKGYFEHPRCACCTDGVFEIFVRFGWCVCCLLPPFVNRQLPCLHTNSHHVLLLPPYTTEAFGLDQKGLNSRDPQNPTENDPRASEVTQTQKSAKNENGIFGISALRGFRKVIICHTFGEKKMTIFRAQKIFRRLWRQSS